MRPGWSRTTVVRLGVALLVVLALVPGTAAADTRVGVSVVVPRGETVDGVTAAAGSVLVLGRVDGDVTALAGNVVVTGEVTGDVTAVGGNVQVDGDVGGSVRGFAVNVGVDGTVDGGVEMIAGFLAIGGRVDGLVDATGVFVEVERGGRLGGGLVTTAYQTSVNGTVRAQGGAAGGGPNATAAGVGQPRAGSRGAGQAGDGPPPRSSAADAVLGLASGGVGATALQLVPVGGRRGGWGIFAVYGFLVNLLFGALLVGLLPNFSARVSSVVTDDPVRSAAAGVAVSVAVPVVLLVLALSVFGLPLSLAGAAVYVVAGWAGAAYGRFALGTWLFVVAARVLALAGVATEPVRNRWARLFAGYLAVWFLIRVPVVGTLADAAVIALGGGALALVAFDAYVRSERGPPSSGGLVEESTGEVAA